MDGWTLAGEDAPRRGRVYEVRVAAPSDAVSVTEFVASGRMLDQSDIERAVQHVRGILFDAIGKDVRLTIRVVG